MNRPIVKMSLNQTNLEQYGWLFSPALGLMVREHETGTTPAWDVEIDAYRQVGDKWEPNTEESYGSYDTLAGAIAENPKLIAVRDWIHGDKVEMW